MDTRSRSSGVHLAALLPSFTLESRSFASILLTFIMPLSCLVKISIPGKSPHLIERHLPSCHYYVWRDDYGASYLLYNREFLDLFGSLFHYYVSFLFYLVNFMLIDENLIKRLL